MIPQGQLMDYFVEVTDNLVSDFDLVEFLHTLTVKAAEASGAAAVGLVLIDHHDRVRYMASSNEEGKFLELLQIQNAEGPCLDAMKTGRPVVNADLGDAGSRWPVFAPAAREAGFQSVHAFPLRLKDRTIGALNIFGVDDARFDPDDVRVVQALADVAAIAILHENDEDQTEFITEQLQAALRSRIVIDQAKGQLARSRSIGTDQAFETLRAMARSTPQKLADAARSVISDLGVERPHTVTAVKASMLPFVWPFWDNGETLQPCRDCPNWQVQLFRLPTSGAVMVREWHDAACAFWERVIAQSNDGVEQLP